jgi:bifunctional non-homologous end joining protein LigD
MALHRSRATDALPQVVPVLPVSRAEPFDEPAYFFEPKYDGLRGLLYLTPAECFFRSKQGNVLAQFRDLAYWIRAELAAGIKDVILDGEVVALDSEGRQDFRALLARRGNLHYAAFDALWLNGQDLRSQSLVRRKGALGKIVWAATTVVSKVFAVEGRGRDLFRVAERLDLEGIMAKRMADRYEAATAWYEINNPAYTQVQGRWELFDARRSTQGPGPGR